MIATIAALAERAEVRPDGKLDIAGVYNCRYTPALPERLAVVLAMRFDIEPLDYGVKQNISVHIVDDDDAELVSLRATPVSFAPPQTAGLPLAYDLILPLTVRFPREGTWTFDVRVNGRTTARSPLRVEIRPGPLP
jgi:hypothetical protein